MEKFVGKWIEVKKEGFEAFADAIGLDEEKRAPYREPNTHFEIKCDGGQWTFIAKVGNFEQTIKLQIDTKFEYENFPGKTVTSYIKIEGDKFVEDMTTSSGKDVHVVREVVDDQFVITTTYKDVSTKSFFKRG